MFPLENLLWVRFGLPANSGLVNQNVNNKEVYRAHFERNSVFTSIIFYDLYNHYKIIPFWKSRKWEVWNGVTATLNWFQTHAYKVFCKEIYILYSESYCKMKFIIQLSSHLKNRNISGNSSLALMQINKNNNVKAPSNLLLYTLYAGYSHRHVIHLQWQNHEIDLFPFVPTKNYIGRVEKGEFILFP